MEYNDELLNPNSFNKIAEEYNKSFLNIKDKHKKEICKNTFKYIDIINNNILELNKNKYMNKNNLKHLTNINNYFNYIKKYYLELNCFKLNNNILKTNYCNNLTNIILNISYIIKYINSNNNIILKLDNKFMDYLFNILSESTFMFGVCKYRK